MLQIVQTIRSQIDFKNGDSIDKQIYKILYIRIFIKIFIESSDIGYVLYLM